MVALDPSPPVVPSSPLGFWYVRHGETAANLRRVFAGRSETPLTDTGLSQAKQAAALLERYPHRWAGVWTSPLSRAHQTAEIVGGALGLTVHVLGTLIERDFGSLEGTEYTTIDRLEGLGLEPEDVLRRRAHGALAEIMEGARGLPPIIVSHGAFFRGVAHALRIYDLAQHPVPNGVPVHFVPTEIGWKMSGSSVDADT